ncbi:MAG TPA: hypothetical protein VKA47_08110 [Solirubrobacterales bacterium]|nr:hypothetical protein [Solirubrobacterales bacterium]
MHGRTRWLVLGTLVVSALGVAAPVAQADTNLGTVAGLTYMRDEAPSTPAPSVLVANAACPAGTHVVGGGATPLAVSNFNVQFWINRTTSFDGPDPDRVPDDGWIGRGFNRFGEQKSMFVFAICSAGAVRYATNHATAAPGAGVGTRAACPSGTHVAGGGAGLSGSATEAYLNSSSPYDSNDADHRPDDGWRARAYNQGGPSKRLTVRAECVDALPRYASTASTDSSQVVLTNCPAGTHAMGGGGLNAGLASRAFLNALYPFMTSMGPPDDQFVLAVSRTNPTRYTGYVVCKA